MGFIVIFTQTNREVLEEIAAFLKKDGIKAHLYTYHYVDRPIGWKLPQHRIQFSERASVVKFLEKVRPRLHVKRVIAGDVLRFLKLYPTLALKERKCRIKM
jgi:intein/homing endonuclease